MLMGPDKRRIEKELAGQRTGVCLEPLPELAPEPAPFPAAKAVRDRVPVSKRLWEVTPGRPRAGKGQQGFNAHPIAEYRRLPARDLMVARMGAISAQASSVNNKRTDMRFPLVCIP